MTTAHLVHGFNVTDGGKATTDRLARPLRAAGFATRQHDYGWTGLLGVRLGNPRIAARVAKAVKPGDIGVGHSNGCAILADAADLGAPFGGLVLVNPALECDRKIASQVGWFHVYCNAGDIPVLVAELLDWLPWNIGRKHFWGQMGNTGFVGEDARCVNFRCPPERPHIEGHSAIFESRDWLEQIAANAQAAQHATSVEADGQC